MVNSAHVLPASTDPFALLVIFCFFLFFLSLVFAVAVLSEMLGDSFSPLRLDGAHLHSPQLARPPDRAQQQRTLSEGNKKLIKRKDSA